MASLKRDLLDLLLGIGVLALGLVILGFTFSQAYALAQNPGAFVDSQLPAADQGPQGPASSFDWTSNDYNVTFTDTSQEGDGAIVAHEWTFGDGATSNAPSPTHRYGTTGGFEVRLTVRDADGLSSTSIGQVQIVPTEIRQGGSMPDFTGGFELNLDFSGIILPFAIVFLTFGMYVVMALAGGMITKAGWNLVKPRPETIRVRLKPKDLTQAIEEDAAAVAVSSPPATPHRPPPPPPQG